MKNIALTINFIICLSFQLIAQEDGPSMIEKNRMAVQNSSNNLYGQAWSVPPPKGELEGSQYVNESYQRVTIFFTNNEIVETNGRFNYYTQSLEIKFEDKVQALIPGFVEKFVIHENKKMRVFVNSNNFNVDYLEMGYYEVVLGSAKKVLLVYYGHILKKPTYNTSLDAGEKNIILIRDDKYLIMKNDKVFNLPDFKKKTIQELEYGDEMIAFVKELKLKFKEQKDIKKFAEYYMSL